MYVWVMFWFEKSDYFKEARGNSPVSVKPVRGTAGQQQPIKLARLYSSQMLDAQTVVSIIGAIRNVCENHHTNSLQNEKF
jgi:hypothetical protein